MGIPSAPTGSDLSRLLLTCHNLERRLAASAGLTVDEFHSLSQLSIHAPCCVKRLCELTGIRQTQISRLLGSLERRGLLLRSMARDDKRKELLTLTSAGSDLARNLLRACALSAPQLAAAVSARTMEFLAGDPQGHVTVFTD